MELTMVAIFILGYVAIAFEHTLRINKAATAIVTAVLCWTVFIAHESNKTAVVQHLNEHLSDISGILFFLLSAMVIVELMDAHDCFDLITQRIRTTSKRRLLWLTGLITFFLSAALDNLTTTIVMVSLLSKLIGGREDRLLFVGLVVIAANAGGAWSPIGDVTTTMLWVGGQISALNIMKMLFLPSAVCLVVPMLVLHFRLKGQVEAPEREMSDGSTTASPREKKTVFLLGFGALLSVPVFKTVTHLPPFMGILLGLGLMWILTEIIHKSKEDDEKVARSVVNALRKIDTPSILFFLGILVAIASLQSAGLLMHLSAWLDRSVGNITAIGVIIGFLSAIVDNVPLVAAAQGMYTLDAFPHDSYFWELLAYCAGTGGSVLIIGSAAGVAAMGMERIDFMWYFKNVSFLAVLGYLAGVVVYVGMRY